MRREAAIAFEQWVVDQRLQKDGAPAGTQDTRNLRHRHVEVEMMQDLLAQHGVESGVSKGELFGSALCVCGRRCTCVMAGLLKAQERDVKAGDARATAVVEHMTAGDVAQCGEVPCLRLSEDARRIDADDEGIGVAGEVFGLVPFLL